MMVQDDRSPRACQGLKAMASHALILAGASSACAGIRMRATGRYGESRSFHSTVASSIGIACPSV